MWPQNVRIKIMFLPPSPQHTHKIQVESSFIWGLKWLHHTNDCITHLWFGRPAPWLEHKCTLQSGSDFLTQKKKKKKKWFGLTLQLISLEPQKLSANFSISYVFIHQYSLITFAIQLTFIQYFIDEDSRWKICCCKYYSLSMP